MIAQHWITPPLLLEGGSVKLIPLETAHFGALLERAQDSRIWKFYPYDCGDPAILRGHLEQALRERDAGRQFPFVIINKSSGDVIGSSRYMDMQPANRKLEIGWTWLHPDYWGSEVNLTCKFLLLQYSFEQMGAIRVQLKTDENNQRSRAAILKIGASFEGVLRNDMIRADGTYRNSAYYSVLINEWEFVRDQLARKIL